MKIAVIGCGSIGRRHIRNLLSLEAAEILAYDTDDRKVALISALPGVQFYPSLQDVFSFKPDGAVVCTPSSYHIPVAMEAARRGCHLFVEKPLSHDLSGIESLLEEVSNRKLVTLIGSNFKFHPSFLKMKEILKSGVIGRVISARCQFGQYLPDWHPWEDYRRSYSSRSDLGGGILLDSHELDYMSWFLGDVSEVFCLSEKLSDLEIDTEDTAEVLFRFENGSIAEIHLDYNQRAYQRDYEFFGQDGTLKWNFSDRKVWLYAAGDRKWEVFDEPMNYDLNAMYVDEMQHFIDCIEKGTAPITDIYSGLKTLRVIIAAKKSAQQKRMVTIEELN